MVQVVWFKRDLRVTDHRPLVEAARRGPVLPLFLLEDEISAAPDWSPLHAKFQQASLWNLHERLQELGTGLVVRRGDAVAALEEVRRELGPISLWAHEETGNGVTYARDRRVRKWARETGVAFTEFPHNGVVRRLRSRDGWARQWEARMVEPLTAPPLSLEGTGATGLGLEPARIVPAGDVLDSFLNERGRRYTSEMSSPLTAERACSRISEYLAWGVISMREVVQRTRVRAANVNDPEWRRSLRSFDARLHWHCHFVQKLEDEPRIEYENFVRAFDGMRENDFRRDWFQAWAEGRTGYPFVDACMRYLHATGWINFRMRAMLVSFASYHLWLHWREPALHLARLFRDYEPGIHYSQMQMQSGTTGINAIRIYNPIKQGLDQDPTGEFIRCWLPEAAGRTDVHTPSAPIVDHVEAVRLARARIGEARRRAGVWEERREVAVKHGSRKGSPRRPAKKLASQGVLFAD
jgi:deoxyribodipyrimidine photo-lyase